MECWEFCREVLRYVPRATRAERMDITWELRDHVMDSAQMLEDGGCAARDSVGRAVERMGDPAEIGRALNAQLSPFWLWLGRACLALAAILCALLLSNWSGLQRLGRNVIARTVPAFLLRDVNWQIGAVAEVRENGESRYYSFPVGSVEGAGYTQYADCDLRLELDNAVVRVFRLYRNPDNGRVGAALVEYTRAPHGYLNETWTLQLTSQRGVAGGDSPVPVVRGEYRDPMTGEPVTPEDPDEEVDVALSWQGRQWRIGGVSKGERAGGYYGSEFTYYESRFTYCDNGAGVVVLLNIPVEPGDTYLRLTCQGEELAIPLPWEVEE